MRRMKGASMNRICFSCHIQRAADIASSVCMSADAGPSVRQVVAVTV